MAIDEALRCAVRPGEGTWRWYAWSSPTVSFGRNERIAGRITAERLATSGLGAVRRPTGGRALLHHRELTYSVVMPLAAEIPWRVAYDAINAMLRDGLQAAGVPVVTAAGSGAIAPDGPVCFDQPAVGELTVDGRKLVGSAVWRQGEAYLQHGSILLHDDQHLLRTLTPDTAPAPPAAALSEAFPGADDSAVGALVRKAIRRAVETHGEVQSYQHSTDPAWEQLVTSQHGHFSEAGWLWRR